tara:strand:+ start:280 stop:561 length:282 start_codon:yes stop_codon:yes gene_type:complete
MEKENKLLHRYSGFHNTEKVCGSESFNKDFAKDKCKDLLLDYFHGITPGLTKFPLEYYNGEVAYVGSVIKNKESVKDIKRPEINSKQLEFNFN